jgi:N-acetylmuramic acid 6-phosphate (MurNAc-6-P) etherase
MKKGGRLFYIGQEHPDLGRCRCIRMSSTFELPFDLVMELSGDAAIRKAVENAENTNTKPG